MNKNTHHSHQQQDQKKQGPKKQANVFFKPINWPLIGAMIKKDGRIYANATNGNSVVSPKFVLAALSLCLIVGITANTMLNAPDNTPPVVEAPAAPLRTVSIYDLRTDAQSQAVIPAQKLVLKSGQSLGPLLQKNNVSNQQAYLISEAFRSVHDPKDLRAGQNINLYFDADQNIEGMTLRPNKDSTVFIRKGLDGQFNANKITAEFSKKLYRIDSQIQNSLYLDAGDLGAPDKVIVQFSQIFAHSVDFQRDIRQGDEFEMMFEMFTDHQGKIIKAGDLIYTRFAPRGKSSSYYLYTKSNGSEGYFDPKGKGAKRMLMRTPVNGARLSSRYGSRRHPVLGYRRKHKGVDFAAPTGTPIMAAGTGTIVRSSRWGSFGNYVRIRHSDGYSTAYAHLSKYARGVKKGRRVRQGQTIGYVGATGRVTGAHLHYEVLKNGRQINPMTLASLSGKPLRKKELPAFKNRAAQIDRLREKTALMHKVQIASTQNSVDKTP